VLLWHRFGSGRGRVGSEVEDPLEGGVWRAAVGDKPGRLQTEAPAFRESVTTSCETRLPVNQYQELFQHDGGGARTTRREDK